MGITIGELVYLKGMPGDEVEEVTSGRRGVIRGCGYGKIMVRFPGTVDLIDYDYARCRDELRYPMGPATLRVTDNDDVVGV